jgi:hypothetical protein
MSKRHNQKILFNAKYGLKIVKQINGKQLRNKLPIRPAAPVPEPQPVNDNVREYNVLKLRNVISPKLELKLAHITPRNINHLYSVGTRATRRKLQLFTNTTITTLCEYFK